MKSEANTEAQFAARWIPRARAAWFIVLLSGIAMYLLSVPLQIAVLQKPCEASCSYGQLTPAQMQALPQTSLTLSSYVTVNIALNALFPIIFCLVAGVIVWRKSNDWFGMYVAYALVLFGFSFSSPLILVSVHYPALLPLVLLWRIVGGANIGVFLSLFPDGRFVPRWIGWIVPIWFVREAAFVFAPDSTPAQILPFLLLMVVFAQVYRYRRVSTVIERQQTKWFLFGITATMVGFAASNWLATSIDPLAVGWNLVGAAGLFASILLIPISIGIAILHSHLWDIDILIRRTLIYFALTLALALVYFGSVLLLQGAWRALTGQSSDLAIVASTLVIAALFAPLRGRIQALIDQRLFRRRYDAAQVLACFGATVRDEVDLNLLKEHLLTVVEETMQPAHASLWLWPMHEQRNTGESR